jgi:tetratricopeptide (TPR) repeat protein
VAESFTGLGYVYESRGKYKEALEMHRKSLDIQTRILGGDSHPSVAATYQNLAALYQSQGNQAQTTEMATKTYHMIHEGPHNHG